MHQVSRAANSITVSWPQPEQTNGNILDYQLRYYDQVSQELPQCSAVLWELSATTTPTLHGRCYRTGQEVPRYQRDRREKRGIKAGTK